MLLVATGIALLGYSLIEQDDERTGDGPYALSDAPTTESIGETELWTEGTGKTPQMKPSASRRRPS
jgi:hypothetical protein